MARYTIPGLPGLPYYENLSKIFSVMIDGQPRRAAAAQVSSKPGLPGMGDRAQFGGIVDFQTLARPLVFEDLTVNRPGIGVGQEQT